MSLLSINDEQEPETRPSTYLKQKLALLFEGFLRVPSILELDIYIRQYVFQEGG